MRLIIGAANVWKKTTTFNPIFWQCAYGPEITVHFICNMLVYQVIIRSIRLVLVLLPNLFS